MKYIFWSIMILDLLCDNVCLAQPGTKGWYKGKRSQASIQAENESYQKFLTNLEEENNRLKEQSLSKIPVNETEEYKIAKNNGQIKGYPKVKVEDNQYEAMRALEYLVKNKYISMFEFKEKINQIENKKNRIITTENTNKITNDMIGGDRGKTSNFAPVSVFESTVVMIGIILGGLLIFWFCCRIGLLNVVMILIALFLLPFVGIRVIPFVWLRNNDNTK